MSLLLLLLIIVVCVLIVIALKRSRVYHPLFQYARKDFLMTIRERECYDALAMALGSEYYIFPQVHLDCLLQPLAYGHNKVYAFRHINQKSVDFVVCDKQFRILLAIELDDRTHLQPARIERDRIVEALFRAAGVRLVRIPGRNSFNAQELGLMLRSAIAPQPQSVPVAEPAMSVTSLR